MSTTLTSYLLSAALLFGGGPKDAPQPPNKKAAARPGRGKLEQRIYPVADLVVPEVQAVGAREGASATWKAERVPRSNPVPKKARVADLAGKTTEAALMRLIRGTVAPESWKGHGGAGRMVYRPQELGLVVYQTPDVQEQIADLLAALRRLQDVEVAVEVRLVTVSGNFLDRLAADRDLKWGKEQSADETGGATGARRAALLEEKQLGKFVAAIQEDAQANVLQAPKVTMFNGQRASLDFTEKHYFLTDLKAVSERGQVTVLPRHEAVRTGFRLSVRPAVSADRRSVLLNVKADLTEMEPIVRLMPVTTRLMNDRDEDGKKHQVPFTQYLQQPQLRTMALDSSFRIPDGKTAVLHWGTRLGERRTEYGPPMLSKVPYVNRLYKNVGYGREAEYVLLLVTPRIVIQEEQEERAASAATP